MGEPIPLTEGAYEARSVIANCQRCVNLYPEANTQDSPFPFTMYPTPGLTALWSPPSPAAARCTYTASNGAFYYVVGSSVYYFPPAFGAPLLLGVLTTRVTPVSMKDNGDTVVIVDGTPNGFKIDLVTNVMTAYGDPNFLGSNAVDYLDGFFIFNQPNTRNFYTSLLNTTAIDPTYVAAKAGAPDPLVRAVCINRQIWLVGTKTGEVWADVGLPTFPFQIVPGAFVQIGTIAIWSMATHDNTIAFVAQDNEGKSTIVLASGYSVEKISTPAIGAALAKYSTLNDAVGFFYKQSDHIFYQVSFPTADKTWVYDLTTKKWHERSWLDENGLEHRHRAQFGAYAYEQNVVGDWKNGTLYAYDLANGTDFGGPIERRRGFPHLVKGGKEQTFNQFQAEMEVGTDEDSLVGDGPKVSLRYSNTRGKSWSTPQEQSLGSTGEYLVVPQWRQLGQARDMVFELFWSGSAVTALNGAYCEVEGAAA